MLVKLSTTKLFYKIHFDSNSIFFIKLNVVPHITKTYLNSFIYSYCCGWEESPVMVSIMADLKTLFSCITASLRGSLGFAVIFYIL